MERRFEVSIHAAREGGDLSRHQRGAYRAVSIHAAREGGDRKCATIRPETSFNPRRPRGRRPHVVLPAQAVISFQSTPPARAATSIAIFCRTPFLVSIHAAREGGDLERISV